MLVGFARPLRRNTAPHYLLAHYQASIVFVSNCVFTPNAKIFDRSRCRRSFVAPHMIICRCASFVEFVAPQQDNHHCLSLPFVEEGETSEDPTQYIHNIVMTTEEAVNEVLNRQIFIR